MPPVSYLPLDNPDGARIHLVSSHGYWWNDVADVDLWVLRIGHDHGDHIHPCDHIHDDDSRVLAFLRQMAGVTGS